MKRLLAAVLLACALPAAAAPLSPPVATPAAAPATQRADATREDASVAERTCLRQTGTRIRYKDGRCSPAVGRSWSRDDLLSTGRTDVVDALRALDPSIR